MPLSHSSELSYNPRTNHDGTLTFLIAKFRLSLNSILLLVLLQASKLGP